MKKSLLITEELHYQLKLHVVKIRDSVYNFVEKAIQERMDKQNKELKEEKYKE